MTPSDKQQHAAKFRELVEIMQKLRAPGGCPWDREQTHASLRQYLLEESFEVLEAIDNADDAHLAEELGDVLLQVVFHAQIAGERGAFDIEEVIDEISQKLVRRHPNVFGNERIDTAQEQSVNWEKIKKSEGKQSTIDGVPKALSALLRAWRVQQKASTVGFDWQTAAPVWEKVREELQELEEACAGGAQEAIDEEFGDLLFSLVNLSRFIGTNPEDALRGTIEKFIRRFQKVEAYFKADGKSLSDLTLKQMDAAWDKIKLEEITPGDGQAR